MSIENINLRLAQIDDKEDREQAIQELKDLLSHPGWKFVVRVLKMNLQYVEDIIFDEDTDDEIRRPFLKARTYIKSLIDLPTNQMDMLTGEDSEEYNPDPYHEAGEEPQNTDETNEKDDTVDGS